MRGVKTALRRAIVLILVLVALFIVPVANPAIVQAAASISVNQASGVIGALITVTGSGFAASEPGINITFDGTAVTSGITANALGNWTGTFTVPYVAYGYHILGAYGSVTLASAVPTIVFNLTAPSISLSQTTAPTGTLLTVTGSGFAANETGITVTFDGNTVASGITANAQGNWTGTFTVTSSAAGAHTIKAYGSTTVEGAAPNLTLRVVNPTISLSQTSGPSGTSVTVSGTGFSAGEAGITITIDGMPIASGITASLQGSWTGTFTVPATAAGPHNIGAYGSATPAASVVGVSFIVKPAITVNRTGGPPGTLISVTGASFGVNETGVTVTYDNSPVASGITANAQGSWSATFAIPASPSGAHSLGASGSTTLATSVAVVTFTVSPTITVSQASGAPGTLITVTGSGFAANETGIIITFDGNPVATGISANAQGGWKGTFNVPASDSGSHNVSAYGSATLTSSVAGITFSLNPAVTISQTSGPPGTLITVNGSGFTSGETGITITFDGNPVATGISANAQGTWSGTFTVPASASGAHSIRAYGLITQIGSIGGMSFKVTPSISISPAAGYVGATVVINGLGFAANGPLIITYDDQQIASTGVNSDANGSFSKSFVAPKSKGGNHIISVADWQTSSAKATFAMDSTPLPTPALLSPKDSARIGILGNTTPTFTWSNVTDPSGVTYVLQVDTSTEFSDLVLGKTDLTASRYALTALESLPYGQYYWRVKAIDGASNESPWSQARLLKSGLMMVWTLVLIVALAVAAVAVGAYFGLFRPRARRREAIVVPGIEMPQPVPGQWRMIESGETTRERQLPWRLALPETTRGGKTVSTEDQARLKVIIDFAQSLPLAEPDYNLKWLIDLIENDIGTQVSAPVYEQLLKGELKVRYEPTWMHHPAYQDLTTLLQKQAILQELNTFVNDVDYCATEAVSLAQQIYHDAMSDLPPDFLEKGGWGFIAAVYADAVSWFAGKSLREPSERDYVVRPSTGSDEGTGESWLCGEEGTSFTGELILVPGDKEALQLRSVHLRLRRTWRSNDQAKQVATMLTQIQLQRSRLLGTFGQFDRLKR